MATIAANAPQIEPGRVVRFHVTRETPYGDRLRLYALAAPEEEGPTLAERFGVGLKQGDDGRWIVDSVRFGSAADAAGMEFGDFVTAADVEVVDVPPKELVYPFGLALLGLVVASQRRRAKKTDSKNARQRAEASH